MPNFALIGAAGYVAPRHMQAIRDIGGRLVAAVDPSDSVGVLDRYGYKTSFFTEFERFDRYVDKVRGTVDQIDYVSICSPNYLHDAHIRWALRSGADVICEKPLVLNERNLERICVLEEDTGKKVYNVLQMRHHPKIIDLKEIVKAGAEFSDPNVVYEVRLDYSTPRGRWYDYSWKGDEAKSGGILTNIGIHLFDMLLWVFKGYDDFGWYQEEGQAIGWLHLKHAHVSWKLSIRPDRPAKRLITLAGAPIDVTKGFEDLHTVVYQNILDGKGWGVADAWPAIRLVEEMRNDWRKK